MWWLIFLVLLRSNKADQRHDALFQLMRDRGAQITHSITYPHVFKDTGLGVMATREIAENETLFRFPLQSYISTLNAIGMEIEPMLQRFDMFYSLVALILYEKSRGEDSPHFVFLSLLDEETVPLPRFWSTRELAELQDDVAVHFALQEKQLVHHQFLYMKHVLKQMHFDQVNRELDRDMFEWAVGIVQTRSFFGANDTIAMIPVADFINHRSTNHVMWTRQGTEFVFRAPLQHGFPKNSQVFYNYGGGDTNMHTLGEYGYVNAAPNKLNAEFLYMDTSNLQQEKHEAFARGQYDPRVLHYKVDAATITRFFRIASAQSLSELNRVAPLRLARERSAAALCVLTLEQRIAKKKTTIAQDYSLLYSSRRNTKLNLAIQFRLGNKIALERNLFFCKQWQIEILPCLPPRIRGLVPRWRYVLWLNNNKL